jgi:Tat protein translocase TatB subunit
MMAGMGFSETIFLFFLALLIFGPKRLPEIARQVGKVMNDLRRASYEFKSQIEAEISNLEMDKKPLPPAPRPLGAVGSLPTKTEPVAAEAQPLPTAEMPPLKAPDA